MRKVIFVGIALIGLLAAGARTQTIGTQAFKDSVAHDAPPMPPDRPQLAPVHVDQVFSFTAQRAPTSEPPATAQTPVSPPQHAQASEPPAAARTPVSPTATGPDGQIWTFTVGESKEAIGAAMRGHYPKPCDILVADPSGGTPLGFSAETSRAVAISILAEFGISSLQAGGAFAKAVEDQKRTCTGWRYWLN